MSISEEIIKIYEDLAQSLETYKAPNYVAYTYNPLIYAKKAHDSYLKKYASDQKKTLFLGMNPGPWGMAQCGVPFGAIPNVMEWLKIKEEIDHPVQTHPKKPVEGFNCKRIEVSGSRLWGLFEQKFHDSQKFFKEHLVLNYCPLIFLDDGGKNLAPDKFSKEFTEPLEERCDAALASILAIIRAEYLVGVGNYAQGNLNRVWKNNEVKIKTELNQDYSPFIGKILHPSPASPAANRGWAEQAERQLQEQGIWN